MADALLETAVLNWKPRFTANGVDATDYARITEPLTEWSQWCQAWSDGALEHQSLGDTALAEGRFLSAGESFARAATYFHFGKFLFVHDPEQARVAHAHAVSALTRALPLLRPRGRRVMVPFEGTELAAAFRCPDGSGPFPTVILIPGLDSTKDEFRDVERNFLDRGMATLAIDGPGQGEAEWTLPLRPDWEVVGRALLDHLATMPEVDIDRVGVWGVSLGGFYATRIAVADLPLRAVVALSGPYDFAAAWPKLNPLTRLAFQVRSHSASPEQAERRARDFTLAGRLGASSTPLLVIAGKQDRLFSHHDGERVVAEVNGERELLLLEAGNHGCANVIAHHRPYSADWMAHHLHVSLTEEDDS